MTISNEKLRWHLWQLKTNALDICCYVVASLRVPYDRTCDPDLGKAENPINNVC